MRYEMISSLQNPQVKIWRTLLRSRSARKEYGFFLAEGEHMAGEAIREKKAAALIVHQDMTEKYEALISACTCSSIYLVNDSVLEALSDTKTPQGIAALCPYPRESYTFSGNLLVALEGVQDPGNVGAILRTMDAADFDCLLVDNKTADPYGPKALRASMGSVFRVPSARCDDLKVALDLLVSDGYSVVAGDLAGESLFSRPALGEKICLLIGNEGAGLSPDTLAMSTHRVKIPMPGRAESLNAAVAASILVYDVLRERTLKESGHTITDESV